MMIVYIGTSHDANGNPRRGWIVDYGKHGSWFVDEGYAGRGALRSAGIVGGSDLGDLPMIVVTPSEYRYQLGRARA